MKTWEQFLETVSRQDAVQLIINCLDAVIDSYALRPQISSDIHKAIIKTLRFPDPYFDSSFRRAVFELIKMEDDPFDKTDSLIKLQSVISHALKRATPKNTADWSRFHIIIKDITNAIQQNIITPAIQRIHNPDLVDHFIP
jgi:hypothetical protein